MVVLDDRLDDVAGNNPDTVLAELRKGMKTGDMGGHAMGASSYLRGGDASDVTYPHFLLNGRLPKAPASCHGKPGTRLRIRFVNAAGDTAFRVALGGHRMTVTHTAWFPVEPADTAALLVGVAEGNYAAAFGLVRTGSGAAPAATVRPKELNGRIVAYRDLKPTDAVRLPAKQPTAPSGWS